MVYRTARYWDRGGSRWRAMVYRTARRQNRANHYGRVHHRVPVPTAFAWPAGIAAGPDGALWFAEFNKSKIGRITTAGDITEYAVPQRYRPRWNHGGAGRRTVVYSRQRL